MSRATVARTLILAGIAAWAAWAFFTRPSDEPFVLSPHERACDALSFYVSDNERLPESLRELFGDSAPYELGPIRSRLKRGRPRSSSMTHREQRVLSAASC